MLMLWGIICGALFGASLAREGIFGFMLGGFFGFFAGLSLHLIMQSKIRGAVAEAQRVLAAAWEAEDKRKRLNEQREQREQRELRTENQTEKPRSALEPAVSVSAATAGASASQISSPMETTEAADERNLAAATTAKTSVSDTGTTTATRQAPTVSKIPREHDRQMPHEPNAILRGIHAAKHWLFGGNTVVRIGIVVLFLGLLFLAMIAVETGLFPIELRLAAIGLAGVAMLVFGWRTKAARPGYGLSLQGAGVAVLYLTTFAALKIYQLIDPGFAFAVMLAVSALSTTLALLQNSRAMALIGFTGGFLVPVLLSTGGGNHVALFSYYAMLNIAVLVIAWFKTWRLLSLVSFFLTFGVASMWASDRYDAIHYASCQAFLIAGWVIYILIGLIYANRAATSADKTGTGYVDGTLIFGMALIGFSLQAGMVKSTPYATAFSALIVGAVYLSLALWQVRRSTRAASLSDNSSPHSPRLAGESLLALGVGFATLAIPLAFGPEVTAAAWAIEGAAIVWVGLRQQRALARLFGIALQPLALFTFMLGISNAAWEPAQAVTQFFLNTHFIGVLMLAIGAIFISWVLRNQGEYAGDGEETTFQKGWRQIECLLAPLAGWYAFLLWCVALANEMLRLLPSSVADGSLRYLIGELYLPLSLMMMVLVSAATSFVIGRRLVWDTPRVVAYIALPLLALCAVMPLAGNAFSFIGVGYAIRPSAFAFDGFGYVVWPIAFAIHYWLMKANDLSRPSKWYAMAHAVSVWLLVLLAGGALARLVGEAGLWRTAWASVTLVVAAIAVLILLLLWVKRATTTGGDVTEPTNWPLQPYLKSYIFVAALPLVIGTFVGGMGLAILSNGNAAPLPYIPLINPVELTAALAVAVGVVWLLLLRRLGVAAFSDGSESASGGVWMPYVLLAFVFINTVWLRIAHHFFDIPWNASQLFNSFFVQTGYAILWSVIALILMVSGHRRAMRNLWITGACLLGVTVAKLFLIDMNNSGGVARVVAFIPVGILIVVVGYFAPLPPSRADNSNAKTGKTENTENAS